MKKIFYKYKGEIRDCNVQLLENEDGTVVLKFDLVGYEQVEENGANYFELLTSIRAKLNSKGIETINF